MGEMVDNAKKHCRESHADANEQRHPVLRLRLGSHHHREEAEEHHGSDPSDDHASATVVPYGGVYGSIFISSHNRMVRLCQLKAEGFSKDLRFSASEYSFKQSEVQRCAAPPN